MSMVIIVLVFGDHVTFGTYYCTHSENFGHDKAHPLRGPFTVQAKHGRSNHPTSSQSR
jgi:hypothetical protein